MITAGLIFTMIGTIGVFLPLLPTTPFLLVAATCFAKGSEKFYNALLNNPLLGCYIRDYREGKGIPLRAKLIAITFLWVGISYSTFFVVPVVIGKIVLILIACGVTLHIALITPKNVNN